MKKLHTRRGGFTLIELMIVVAIIGILAAIAIPNFLRFQLKAKSSEGKTNLAAIRTAEESYFAEYGVYVSADCRRPPAIGNNQKVDLRRNADAGKGFDRSAGRRKARCTSTTRSPSPATTTPPPPWRTSTPRATRSTGATRRTGRPAREVPRRLGTCPARPVSTPRSWARVTTTPARASSRSHVPREGGPRGGPPSSSFVGAGESQWSIDHGRRQGSRSSS